MKKSIPAAGLAWVVLALGLVACTPEIEKQWEFPIGTPIYSTPLVVGDLIVFGSEDGTLYAVDKSGQARWQFQAPSSEIFAHPQTDGKKIYFGATNQKFYALDLKGQVVWQFAARERIKSDPAVVDGVAYLTSYDGMVYALKADTGKKIWQFPPEVASRVEPAAAEEPKKDEETAPVPAPREEIKTQAFSYAAPVIRDGVLYVGNLDGYLYALQIADGKLKWRFKAQEGITSTACVEDGIVYFGSKDDTVYAIDAETGTKVLWKVQTGNDVLSSPRAKDGVLYIGSSDKKFYALDAKTGQEKCHFKAAGPIISYGVFFKDLVIFAGGQGDGGIYALDRLTCKPVYSYRTGYKIESDPVLEGNLLYVTSGDRKLYSFKINRGAK